EGLRDAPEVLEVAVDVGRDDRAPRSRRDAEDVAVALDARGLAHASKNARRTRLSQGARMRVSMPPLSERRSLMLTHCPECQKELSTAATQCPHCGAPVNQGQLAGGGAPVARPVTPGYAQPGYAQPGYPQGAGQPPEPPKGHFWRNCCLVGCLVTVLLCGGSGVAFYMWANKHFPRDPQQVAALSESVAPGAKPPTG